jgi:DNA-binding response OmpR family regulator
MTTVLVVDDDPDMQLVLRIGLEEGGFRVATADDGPSALEMFHSISPDLVIIDINLGYNSFDGFELCRRLRKVSGVSVIFHTVSGDDVDQLVGLASGADDYLVKPVSLRMLCARINLALSHSREVCATKELFVDGDVRIDIQSRQVFVRNTVIKLTRIEFDILAALAVSPDRVLTRDQITTQVWGDWYGDDSHLEVHLCRLRKKIQNAGGPRIGQNVRGVGFKLH